MANVTDLPQRTEDQMQPGDLLYVSDGVGDFKATLQDTAIASISLAHMVTPNTPLSSIGAIPTSVKFQNGAQKGFAGIDPGSGTITTGNTGIAGGGFYQVNFQIVIDYDQGTRNSPEDVLGFINIGGTNLQLASSVHAGGTDGTSVNYSFIAQIPDSTVVDARVAASSPQTSVPVISASFSMQRVL